MLRKRRRLTGLFRGELKTPASPRSLKPPNPKLQSTKSRNPTEKYIEARPCIRETHTESRDSEPWLSRTRPCGPRGRTARAARAAGAVQAPATRGRGDRAFAVLGSMGFGRNLGSCAFGARGFRVRGRDFCLLLAFEGNPLCT